jgi:uncharacterized protein (DUF1684 family)
MSELTEFRKEKDRFFKLSPQSPLDPEQKKAFEGLHYYPENEAMVLELPLERYVNPELVRMQTSTGDVQDYRQIGQIRFEVEGEPASLQVYESAYGGDLFLPFVDATAPAETYGAGRYLEPETIGKDVLLVDFNVAYNPYCAYNDMWSCPIPPRENRIKVRIEAGEKKFK